MGVRSAWHWSACRIWLMQWSILISCSLPMVSEICAKQTYVVFAWWIRGSVENFGIVIGVYRLTETVLVKILAAISLRTVNGKPCVPNNGVNGILLARWNRGQILATGTSNLPGLPRLYRGQDSGLRSCKQELFFSTHSYKDQPFRSMSHALSTAGEGGPTYSRPPWSVTKLPSLLNSTPPEKVLTTNSISLLIGSEERSQLRGIQDIDLNALLNVHTQFWGKSIFAWCLSDWFLMGSQKRKKAKNYQKTI